MPVKHAPVCLFLILFGLPAFSQDTQQQAPPQLPPKKPTVPDYPERRTLTIGIFGWGTIPGAGPDVVGGKAATTYSTLDHLGKDHLTPGVEVFFPITRTGELHLEGFLSKGDGTQTAPANTTLFGSTSYSKGDFLSTQYQITSAKLYLDDLLYPFKFPVQKFRLKSLWEVQWLSAQATIDAPLKATTDSSGNAVSNTISGTRSVILPTFGIAAEYAPSAHVLLRAAASGFGIPHHSDLWDAEATVSYRRHSWELRGGYKITHFKTSPQKDEFLVGDIQGGFIGLRYHW
jgi:hypothetical protein